MALSFDIVTYLGGAIVLSFVIFSLACGLYFIADWIEENTAFAKRIIQTLLLSILIIHIIMLAERISFKRVLFSMACHIWYATMLIDYPYINLAGVFFIGSVILSVANHFVWFFYFTHTHHLLLELTAFFGVAVWMVPLSFFISLSANDNVLPLQTGNENSHAAYTPVYANERFIRPSASQGTLSNLVSPVFKATESMLSRDMSNESVYDDVPQSATSRSSNSFVRKSNSVFKQLLRSVFKSNSQVLPVKKL